MESGPLATYLQDHYAGASGGISLIESLKEGAPDAAEESELAEIEAGFHQEREALLGLMERAGADPSTVKNAGAWIGEHLSQMKLRSSAPEGRLLKLEAMIMGVTGKLHLWRSLLALIEAGDTTFTAEEISDLKLRAEDQIARLQAIHSATALRLRED